MNDDENPGEGNSKPGVPPIIRTIAYISGALGAAGLYADVDDPLNTIAKVLVGFALALGITYNPSFGIGSK